jgi:DNA-binding NarL/FixJ family response regulator
MRRSDESDQTRTPLGPDATVRRLSPREREIAILLARGLGDAEIGSTIGMAAGSVGVYVARIRRRLKVDSRRELAAWVAARLDPDDLSGGSLRRAPGGG